MAVNAKQQAEVLAIAIDSKGPIRDVSGNKSIVSRISLQVQNNLQKAADGTIATADLIPQSYFYDEMVGYQSPETDFAQDVFAKAPIGTEVKYLALTNGAVTGCQKHLKIAKSASAAAADWVQLTVQQT